jgi:1-acyl-sn-glycerol-3-phosphate acyltransferase
MIADACFSLIRAYATVWMRSRCRVLLFGRENLDRTPRGRRVYMVINHSTSYDLVALMHLSGNRFSVVMDQAAFEFPIIRFLLHGAGFIPLDKETSRVAIQQAVNVAATGTPLFMSLTEGYTAIGVPGHERARTGGIRIAHLAGADLYPVFVMVEEGRRVTRSFKGTRGRIHLFTTFRNALYFVSLLPPIAASSFGPNETYDTYRALAEQLRDQGERERERIACLLRDDPAGFSAMRRRGGCTERVTW